MPQTYILVVALPDLPAGALFYPTSAGSAYEHRTRDGRAFLYEASTVTSGWHFKPYFPTLHWQGVNMGLNEGSSAPGPAPVCRFLGVQVPTTWPSAAHCDLQLKLHEAMTALAARYGNPTPEQIQFANPLYPTQPIPCPTL